MSEDQQRWDRRHGATPLGDLTEPDGFIVRALDGLGDLQGLDVLDLACGAGRHALELARRGARVHGWDVSPVGLDLASANLALSGYSLETRRVDLVTGVPAGTAFDLVVCVDFLLRDVASELPSLIREGGHLLHCTYTRAWPGERPSMRWRLDDGELPALFEGLEAVVHEEQGGRAGILARRTSPENS